MVVRRERVVVRGGSGGEEGGEGVVVRRGEGEGVHGYEGRECMVVRGGSAWL